MNGREGYGCGHKFRLNGYSGEQASQKLLSSCCREIAEDGVYCMTDVAADVEDGTQPQLDIAGDKRRVISF